MKCHICQGEAIDRCYECGQLFCERHGKVNCVRCETGFAPGDRREDRVSPARLPNAARAGWWRPQEAEDYEPHACEQCQGLTPYKCLNCGDRYCRDHAGKNGWCSHCHRTRRSGNIFLLLLVLVLGALTVFGLVQAK